MSGGPDSDPQQTMVRSTPLEWGKVRTILVPKQRRLNAAFDPYLRPPGVRIFHGRAFYSKVFRVWPRGCGAVPLASRLRFSSANAVAGAVRAVPGAPIVPKTFKAFGGVRIDNADWLRDRKDPRVVSYLDAENAYANARLEPIKPLVDELAAELKAREAQEDASVPATYNGYVYQHRFSRGAQYPYIVRHKDVPGAQEEIVLDVGALAAGHPQQYQLGSWTVSPDNTRVAFAGRFHRWS